MPSVFLCHASEDKPLVEPIQIALANAGCKVFYDEQSLPAGGDYQARIREAIQRCDMFVFVASPASIAPGKFSLTELKFARERWPGPVNRVLSVVLAGLKPNELPAYLKSTTVLSVSGNAAAEVRDAVEKMLKRITPQKPRRLWDRLTLVHKIYLIAPALIVGIVIAVIYQAWTPTPPTYIFNASGAQFTYWNAPVQNLLRDVSSPCPGPAWICRSTWLSEWLFRRQFFTVQVEDNDITKVVSCQPFSFPSEETSALAAYDPSNALRQLAKSFPQCLSLTQDLSTRTFSVRLKRNGLTEIRRENGELLLLCGCPPELVESFK
jgi:hypothetical protein